MQQTTKYQFNLIDTSDAFSPNPLNENAQKLEAALIGHEAAVEARLVKCEEENAFVHLLGPVEQTSWTLTVDLSGVDMSKYRALFAVVHSGKSSGSVKVDGLSLDLNSYFTGMVWFLNAGGWAAIFGGGAWSTTILGSTAGGTLSGSTKWDSIKSIVWQGVEFLDLYGVKA